MAGPRFNPAQPFRFSTEARADLARLLQPYQPTTTLADLEKAVQRYHATQSWDRSLEAQDRRVRAWALALSKQLETTRTCLHRLLPADAVSLAFTDAPDADALHEQGRERLDHLLVHWASIAKDEATLRIPKSGPKPRVVLNIAIAAALKASAPPR